LPQVVVAYSSYAIKPPSSGTLCCLIIALFVVDVGGFVVVLIQSPRRGWFCVFSKSERVWFFKPERVWLLSVWWFMTASTFVSCSESWHLDFVTVLTVDQFSFF
jgi:hypothetical protein